MCHGGMLPADLAGHGPVARSAHLQCHPSQGHRHGAPGSELDQYEVGWGLPVLAAMPVVHDRPQNSHTQGL